MICLRYAWLYLEMNGFHEGASRPAQTVDPCVSCVIVMNAYQRETWVVGNVARCGGVQNCDPGEENGCEISSKTASGYAAPSVMTRAYGALVVDLYDHHLGARLSLAHRRPSVAAAVSDLGP